MAIIDKSSDYFNTVLYTGDDTNDRQIDLDWSPDLTWIKARNVAYSHILFDRIRGLGFSLNSNGTNADRNVGSEFSWSNSGCTTDSFTVDRGSNESLNESGRPMVAWNWKAGGTASSNTDGSITSSVSANQDAGFSIVSYTGNETSGATVGHGLGSKPAMMIFKERNGTTGWVVYHDKNTSAPATEYLQLNSTAATADYAGYFNDTEPTSSVFTLGNDTGINQSGDTYIAYCFAEKKGFSKFGSYTGNGNADGTFVYLGFKPAFVMIKATGLVKNWLTFDNRRLGYNGAGTNKQLHPNTNGTESSGNGTTLDILSNGFKTRTTDSDENGSGNTYIYMAFAENPLVGTNNIPATAR